MKRLLMIIMLSSILVIPVSAVNFTAPAVPEYAEKYMPVSQESFGQGLLEVLRDALMYFRPDIKEASKICLGVIAAVMILMIVRSFPGMSSKAANLAGVVTISGVLLSSAGSLINLGAQTISQISEYGKLILPVMTSAMAAQGGITSSAALYTGTVIFDTILGNLISKLLIPMIYLYLAVAAAGCAVEEDMLKKLRGGMKWLMTWILKNILYIFTGYIGITGVVSGATDTATLKAAKLTISGVVPVVGGILSDASEAILVSAGAVKNAVGLYGLFAILAIWIGPFLKIGAHYLLLKATGILCSLFGGKQIPEIIEEFSVAMGFLLGMTGAVCVMLMISMVCFLRGVG